MARLDHSTHYEIEQKLPSAGAVERMRAHHRSTGTTVVLHRVPLPRGTPAEDLFARIQRWGPLRDPRLPLFMDAWETSSALEFAMIEPKGEPLNTPAAMRILQQAGPPADFSLAAQTLRALEVLHAEALSHRDVLASVFAVYHDGFIAMTNSGICARLNDVLGERSDGGSSALLLASNTQMLDVADWAAAVAGVLIGQQFFSPEDISSDQPLSRQVDLASAAISRQITNKALAAFLLKAIEGRGQGGTGFENAQEAMQALRAAFPKEDFPG